MSFWSRLIVLLFWSATVVAAPAKMQTQAQVYKWVDQEGVVHYSDSRPEDKSISAKVFMESPISIDEKGMVIQTLPASMPEDKLRNTQSRKNNPEGNKNIFINISEWFATLQSTFISLIDAFKGIVTSDKFREADTTSNVRAPNAGDESVVISNDNMEDILQQVEQEKTAKAEALAHRSVEIFTAPWCGYCKKAVAFLELNHVAYEEYDVSANPTAALRQKLLGGDGGIPFAVINGEKIQGWNQMAYARALGL